MIKKEKLLNQLDLLIDLKKNLTPLLDKHISSSLTLSQLKKIDREAILEKLSYFAKVQTKHIDLLNDMKKNIAESTFDVY